MFLWRSQFGTWETWEENKILWENSASSHVYLSDARETTEGQQHGWGSKQGLQKGIQQERGGAVLVSSARGQVASLKVVQCARQQNPPGQHPLQFISRSRTHCRTTTTLTPVSGISLNTNMCTSYICLSSLNFFSCRLPFFLFLFPCLLSGFVFPLASELMLILSMTFKICNFYYT